MEEVPPGGQIIRRRFAGPVPPVQISRVEDRLAPTFDQKRAPLICRAIHSDRQIADRQRISGDHKMLLFFPVHRQPAVLMHDVGLCPLFPPSYIAVEMIGMIMTHEEIQFLRRILKKRLQPVLCVFVEIKNKKACLIS